MDTTSAATLVGAVLEQAGYISQSRLLDALGGFFVSAGHLIYLIAVIGGLTSLVVLGSARLVRYFLVGPIFFWFLVIPRSELDGVRWNIAGEQRKIGESASEDVVDATTYANGEIKISTAYKLYVTFINNIVAESVRVISAQTEKKDAFFSDRATAFSAIINAQMSNPLVVGLYDNLLWGKGDNDPNNISPCADLMFRALAGAPAVAREKSVESLQSNMALSAGAAAMQGDYTERFQKIAENRADFIQAYSNTETNARVMPNATMRRFLTNYQDHPTLQPLYQRVVSGSDSMTCREVWDSIAVGVTMEAELLSEKLRKEYRQKWSEGGLDDATLDRYEQDFCADLASKVGQEVGDGQSCSLVPLFFVHMMRNATGPDKMSGIVNRFKERAAFVTRANDDGVIPMDAPSQSGWRLDKDASGKPILGEGGADSDTYLFRNTETGEKQYFKAASLMNIDNQFAHAFNNSLKLQLEEIRNQLFAFAVELPYWQGLILYIVSYLYPVWALMVLLPGKAINFFRILLFWLWAKSWDIGFALAYVFEQVLWNLIPQQFSVTQSFSSMAQSPEQIQSLVTFYADTLRLDPSYNVYIYYWALSTVVLSIPSITGAAILKGQRAALSSLSDGVNKMSGMMGSRGKGAYGLIAGNKHVIGSQHTSGMAGLSMTPHSGSITSWLGRGGMETPLAHAALNAGASLFRDTAGGNATGTGVATVAALTGAAALANADNISGGSSSGGAGGNGGNQSPMSLEKARDAAMKRIEQAGPEAKVALGGAALLHLANGAFGSVEEGSGEGFKQRDGKAYVDSATKKIVDLLKSDTGYRAAFEAIFGEHGRYSAHYADYQAITASMDPNGGFEMENYVSDLLSETTNSFKTQVNSLREVGQEAIIGTVMSTPRGKLLPRAVVGAMILWSADDLAEQALGAGQDETSSPILDHFFLTDGAPVQIDGKLFTDAAVDDYFQRVLYERAPNIDDMSILSNGFNSPLTGEIPNDPILSKHIPGYDQQPNEFQVLADRSFATDEAANKAMALMFVKASGAESVSEAFDMLSPTPGGTN